MAGIDFISEDEIVAYTICRIDEIALSNRDDPKGARPNHLKAVVLDVATGNVKQQFDWPTQGRGSMVRVTHSGNLLTVRDNLIQTLTPEGKVLATLRIPKVTPSDMVFAGLSQTLDTVVVTQSSEAPGGKTVNGVAVLDTESLKLLAQWHDDGDSWNIAASHDTAVRTSNHGSRLELRKLKDGELDGTEWKTIWPHSSTSIPRPIFLSDSEFVVPLENSVQIFKASGKVANSLPCTRVAKVATSRDGKVLTAACALDSYYGSNGEVHLIARVYQGSLLNPLFEGFKWWALAGFDIALSPNGSRLAIVDRSQMAVFRIR